MRKRKDALSTAMCEVSSLIVSFPSPNLTISLTCSPQMGKDLKKKKKALGNDLDHISPEITSQNQSAQKGKLGRS